MNGILSAVCSIHSSNSLDKNPSRIYTSADNIPNAGSFTLGHSLRTILRRACNDSLPSRRRNAKKFNAEIIIILEENSQEQKAKSAMPNKPAILLS